MTISGTCPAWRVSAVAGGLSLLGAEFRQLEDQAEGLVDRLGGRKRAGHIRSQKNEIGALPEPLGVLALYTRSQESAQIISRPEIVTSFAVRFLLHHVITMTKPHR